MQSQTPSPSLLTLVNGLILTDPESPEVVPHGMTVIQGNRMRAVNVPVPTGELEGDVIDCSGSLIMPGLINAHTHAAMSLLRGIADDLALTKWLNEYIFPSENRYVNPEFVYLGTRLAAVEMALNGITTFADGYFHMEHAARAAIEVGLRAVVAQGILDVPTPDAAAGAWKPRVERFLTEFPDHELVKPALFCHSPYLCSAETLREARHLARSKGARLFCHVAETRWEVDHLRATYGASPVEHLHRIDVLGEPLVAVHAVHVSDEERSLLARSGTAVVHCPESNMKLASGVSPVQDLLDRGVPVALGTDGPASNNNLDLFEEMRTAALLAKVHTGNPEVLSGRTVLKMATTHGARALGMANEIGSLKPGMPADLIVVDFDRPHLTPVYDPISHLVYAARGSDVRDVIVNGNIVVRNGAVQTVDVEGIRASVQDKAAEISRGLRP